MPEPAPLTPRLHSTPRANSTRPLKSNFLADNRSNAGSTTLPSEAADALINLASAAVRAGQTFAQWATSMLQRFGEAVRQYLQGAWQAAMRTSEVGAINPQGTGKRGGVLQATERASRSKGSLDKRADAPQSLFTYDARPLNKLTAGERDTLRVLRGLEEHQGHSIIPVRVTSLSRSKGGPRRIDTLTEAAYGWTGAFAALFKKTAFFYDGPPILNGAVADSPPHTPYPLHV